MWRLLLRCFKAQQEQPALRSQQPKSACSGQAVEPCSPSRRPAGPLGWQQLPPSDPQHRHPFLDQQHAHNLANVRQPCTDLSSPHEHGKREVDIHTTAASLQTQTKPPGQLPEASPSLISHSKGSYQLQRPSTLQDSATGSKQITTTLEQVASVGTAPVQTCSTPSQPTRKESSTVSDEAAMPLRTSRFARQASNPRDVGASAHAAQAAEATTVEPTPLLPPRAPPMPPPADDKGSSGSGSPLVRDGGSRRFLSRINRHIAGRTPRAKVVQVQGQESGAGVPAPFRTNSLPGVGPWHIKGKPSQQGPPSHQASAPGAVAMAPHPTASARPSGASGAAGVGMSTGTAFSQSIGEGRSSLSRASLPHAAFHRRSKSLEGLLADGGPLLRPASRFVQEAFESTTCQGHAPASDGISCWFACDQVPPVSLSTASSFSDYGCGAFHSSRFMLRSHMEGGSTLMQHSGLLQVAPMLSLTSRRLSGDTSQTPGSERVPDSSAYDTSTFSHNALPAPPAMAEADVSTTGPATAVALALEGCSRPANRPMAEAMLCARPPL